MSNTQKSKAELLYEVTQLQQRVRELETTEETLRQREDRYHRLADMSPDAIALADLEGGLIFVNQQAVRLHGFESVDEVLATGKTIFDFVAPDQICLR